MNSQRIALLGLCAMLLLTPAAVRADQTLALQDGFNFLGLTVTPDGGLTTAHLLENDAVKQVFLFDTGTQSFVYQIKVGTSIVGNALPVTPGVGFIVKSSGSANVTIPGSAYETASFSLGRNFNLIGVPAMANAVAAQPLFTANADLSALFRWDLATQSFGFLLKNGDQIFGAPFNLEPGRGYFVRTSGGFTLSLDGSQPPAKTLAPLGLSKATDSMTAGTNYDLAGVTATATYSDQSSASVAPTWSVPQDQGSVEGSTFTPAGGATTATLTAAYTEGGVTRTATLTLTITPAQQTQNPAARSITVAGYPGRALIAVNTLGTADGGAQAEAVGTLPANNPASAPRFAPAIPVRSMMKDRAVSGSGAPLRAPARAVKLDHTSTTHTFVLTQDPRGESMPATKVYGTESGKCVIFCETAELANAASVNWNSIGQLFDQADGIYDKMVNAYGAPCDLDNNGKVIILYYRMTEMNTLGYFFSVDLDTQQGNQGMEIFYMNLTWGVDRAQDATGVTDPAAGDMVRTLAHEFQHLINFAQRRVLNSRPAMDTWMDEGLAESAEQLVVGTVGEARIQTFKSDEKSLIRNGQPVCVWKNNDEAYALAYTFFQYLKNQAASRDAIFKKFIEQANGDYRAVETIMRTENPAFANVTFADLLCLHRVANVVNGDGIYGYRSEKTSFDFKAANGIAAPENLSGITLEPGGAVNVYPTAQALSGFTPSGSGQNIQFVKINP